VRPTPHAKHIIQTKTKLYFRFRGSWSS
jgi:hypothetical protein